MNSTKFKLSILLSSVLMLSACKLPVDGGVPVAAEDESMETVIGSETSNESMTIVSDGESTSTANEEILEQDEAQTLKEEIIIAEQRTADTETANGETKKDITPETTAPETSNQEIVNSELVSDETNTPESNAEASEDSAESEQAKTDETIDENTGQELPVMADSRSQQIIEKNEPVVTEPVIDLPENILPIAINDSLTTKEDTALRGIDLLANDTDADGDALRVISFSQGANGGYVEQSVDGLFVYTPSTDFNGSDEFSYVVGDGRGGVATAIASINVISVNDITLTNDEFYVKEDEILKSIDLIANDYDKDGGTLEILAHTQSVMGGLVKPNSDGSLEYKPALDFHGKDEFFYVVTDGQGGREMGVVTVWVESVDDQPIASPDSFVIKQSQSYEMLLLNNDKGLGDGADLMLVSNPEHGVITFSQEGAVLYEPNAGYYGSDGFVYKLVDSNGDESIATVSIQVECITDCNRTFVLSWNPSESAGVVGYKIYVGNTSEDYTEILEVGDVNKYEYFTETKGTYYFAVSAVNAEDIESSLTEEVLGTF